jgi:hypothetical protein
MVPILYANGSLHQRVVHWPTDEIDAPIRQDPPKKRDALF